jgi:hypothetical protein
VAFRWPAILGIAGFFLTVTIVAFAAVEAITATTGMSRMDALGDVFFWLGMGFSGVGVVSTGSGVARGQLSSGIRIGIPTLLFGLAAIAYSLAVRAGA